MAVEEGASRLYEVSYWLSDPVSCSHVGDCVAHRDRKVVGDGDGMLFLWDLGVSEDPSINVDVSRSALLACRI